MKQQSQFPLQVILFAILASSETIHGTGATNNPILIIPGLTGSRLDVVDTEPGPILCRTRGGLWVNELRFVLELFDCISREMILLYNSTTNNYSAEEGVTVSVPGFGRTDTVEHLNTNTLDPIDPSHLLEYQHTFVEYFVQRGYVRGKSIRAAPYDWRLAAEQLQQRGYYANLTSLIETMYRENNNSKVTLIVHSLGGPVSLYFLTSGIVTQEWKDMYIANYVTLSGAWSGNKAVMAEISGISEQTSGPGIFKYLIRIIGRYLGELLHPIIRSMQSAIWLLPRASVWNDTILVQTPTRNYTANDYQDLFRDIGQEQLFTMYNGVKDINPDFPAPNVSTYCFYGIGLPTPQSFVYSQSFPEGAMSNPLILMGDGDGTVNLRNSEICLRWQSSGYPFRAETFEKVEHVDMVRKEVVLRSIGGIVGAPLDPLPVRPNKAPTAVCSTIGIIICMMALLPFMYFAM